MWHNLGEHVEKTVAAHHRCVLDHYAALEQAAAQQAPDPGQLAGQATAAHAENRARVVRARQRYEQVQALNDRGQEHQADHAGAAPGARDRPPLLPRRQRR